ncbi:MAG: oxidoreductase, partial [Chloroflexota bacterium]
MALKVGIIGCGDIALKNYLPGTRALAGTVDIVATCDTVYERAERAREEFGTEECRAYGSAEELLRDPEVEGVEILTPWPFHSQLALQAL